MLWTLHPPFSFCKPKPFFNTHHTHCWQSALDQFLWEEVDDSIPCEGYNFFVLQNTTNAKHIADFHEEDLLITASASQVHHQCRPKVSKEPGHTCIQLCHFHKTSLTGKKRKFNQICSVGDESMPFVHSHF